MTSQTPSLSFEVFPPNPAVGNEKILRALEDMQGLAPHFISVTASNNKYNIKETTVPLADHIQNDLAIPTIAHLPAIYLSKEKVADTLRDLDAVGVHRILALRGDIIPGVEPLKDFKYATDLIEFIKEEAPQFDIIGACYPEGHPDSPNQISDIQNLKKKVDAGAELLLSQLFFDNDTFFNFAEDCRLAGINVPVIPGIMPCINAAQIQRMVTMCGAKFPEKFQKIVHRYGDNKAALFDAGMSYCESQIIELLANDVEGIHLYTMNNVRVAKRLTEGIKNLI